MIDQTHAYFYYLKNRDGEVHSSDSSNNHRNLKRQLKRQMLGMDQPCSADFFVVAEFREGGNRSKCVARLTKDEDNKLKEVPAL